MLFAAGGFTPIGYNPPNNRVNKKLIKKAKNLALLHFKKTVMKASHSANNDSERSNEDDVHSINLFQKLLSMLGACLARSFKIVFTTVIFVFAVQLANPPPVSCQNKDKLLKIRTSQQMKSSYRETFAGKQGKILNENIMPSPIPTTTHYEGNLNITKNFELDEGQKGSYTIKGSIDAKQNVYLNSIKYIRQINTESEKLSLFGKIGNPYTGVYKIDSSSSNYLKLMECPRNFGHIVKIISAFRRLPVTCNQ